LKEIETKENKNNYSKEKQLKQKEGKPAGTYLDGNLFPQADFKNRTTSWVVVDTSSMTRKECLLFENLPAWWW
jgi:hypothetical protein